MARCASWRSTHRRRSSEVLVPPLFRTVVCNTPLRNSSLPPFRRLRSILRRDNPALSRLSWSGGDFGPAGSTETALPSDGCGGGHDHASEGDTDEYMLVSQRITRQIAGFCMNPCRPSTTGVDGGRLPSWRAAGRSNLTVGRYANRDPCHRREGDQRLLTNAPGCGRLRAGLGSRTVPITMKHTACSVSASENTARKACDCSAMPLSKPAA